MNPLRENEVELSLRALPWTLRPSLAKHLPLLGFCVGFTAIGIWMLHDGNAKGWFVAGVFSLGVAISFINLLPGAASLRLTEDGFTFASLFRQHSVRWREVRSFGVAVVPRRRMVGWNWASAERSARSGSRTSAALSGFEAGLPDSYGLSVEHLAQVMALLHARHGSEGPPPKGVIEPRFGRAEWAGAPES